MLDQGPVDGVGLGRDLQPGGRALAAGAHGDVLLEHVLEQPRPRLAPRDVLGLHAQGQLRLELERVALGLGRLGHHLGAELGVGRKHAVVAHHVHAGRRDEGA